MKILANDGMDAAGIKKLQQAGFEVTTDKVEQAHLAKAINENGYEVLLVRSATKVPKEVIEACTGLKLIGRGGVGLDNIDTACAKEKGIPVINTPAASSQSVAELAFAHLFCMARFLYDANRNMPSKGHDDFKSLKKTYSEGIELRGKTLGIIGFGRIGQNLARYALGCGMKVLAYDPQVDGAELDLGIEGVNVNVCLNTSSFEEVLANSDFISLHVPKQKDGGAVISFDELAKMKDGVILVNTARGGVVDEDALIEALNSGKVAHAALDVFEQEPTPRNDLLSHPRISLTPHIGASTSEAQERIGDELAGLIIAHFQKQPA